MGKSEPDQDPSEPRQYVLTRSVALDWSTKESSQHEATGMWSPVTTLPTKKSSGVIKQKEFILYWEVSSDANPWPKPKIWAFPSVLITCPNILTKYGLRPTVRLKKFKVQQSFQSMLLQSPHHYTISDHLHTCHRCGAILVPGGVMSRLQKGNS